MQTWNDKHKSNLILFKALDLVEEEEQITHQTFKFDPDDLGNEKEYTSVKAHIQEKDSKEPSDNYSLMYKVETSFFKGLDLVEEEEQITHQTFKFDPDDLGNEEKYTSVKEKIHKSHLTTIHLHIRLRCTVFETLSSSCRSSLAF
ncbi:uncharacterized protein F5891DRAFT_1188324 [Suillus fuscotomentosus]|uniref:Uncharacterized protein n=1 Tax=Suillus fuscotomentosus TaxID=1912939 RepID=A0AAD4HLG9_9AGAM|nr:uncharacterized protein F5891DRAFT_1188324 [Suillus fuscotomentosus]KAG1900837.1 hypothetical protein F5891DRAFT_1188324 [Suillus fuscotomentosus]